MTPSQAFTDLLAGRIEVDEYIDRVKAEVEAELRRERPATRYGRDVVFGDGFQRRLGLIEFLLIKAGVKQTVARRPTTNRRES